MPTPKTRSATWDLEIEDFETLTKEIVSRGRDPRSRPNRQRARRRIQRSRSSPAASRPIFMHSGAEPPSVMAEPEAEDRSTEATGG